MSTLCKTFLHTREKDVFFLNTLKISLAQTSQEGPFQVMFVETQQQKKQKTLKTCKLKGQDATKITSASAHSHIKLSWKTMSLLVRTLCWCLVIMTIFLSVSPFSPSFVTMSSSAPSGVRRSENFYYALLALSRHNINLVFDEENMKPERHSQAPKNAGIDPSTTKISKWYQESTREDDDPHSPSSNRGSDLTGAHGISDQVREPIANDVDRLAMKRGDMLPPFPQRVANPRIGEDQAFQEFHSKSDKMHRVTSDDDFCTSVVSLWSICLPTICEKNRYTC